MKEKNKQLIEYLENIIEHLKDENVFVDEFYSSFDAGLAERNNGYMMERGYSGDKSIKLEIFTKNPKTLYDFLNFKDKSKTTSSTSQ